MIGAWIFFGIVFAYVVFVLVIMFPPVYRRWNRPIHTVESVAKELADGLENGTIVLREEELVEK